jgi:DNA polymerase III epsilon subunit-like protein
MELIVLAVLIWVMWKFAPKYIANKYGSHQISSHTAGFAVLDFETTGLSPAQADRVVQVAVLHISSSGAVEQHWSTLINPGRDVGPTFIHGITNQDVISSPTYGEIHDELMGLLNGRVVVAHNARFDLNFLFWEAQFAGRTLDLSKVNCFDTMSIASEVFPNAHNKKLETLVSHLNFNPQSLPGRGFHDALFDVYAEGEVLRHYLRKAPGLVARNIRSGSSFKVSQMDIRQLASLQAHRESELEAIRLVREIESKGIASLDLRAGGEVLFLGHENAERRECEKWIRKFGFLEAHGLTKSRTVLVVIGSGNFNSKPLIQAEKWGIPIVTVGQLRHSTLS